MRENTDQKNSKYGHFSRGELIRQKASGKIRISYWETFWKTWNFLKNFSVMEILRRTLLPSSPQFYWEKKFVTSSFRLSKISQKNYSVELLWTTILVLKIYELDLVVLISIIRNYPTTCAKAENYLFCAETCSESCQKSKVELLA